MLCVSDRSQHTTYLVCPPAHAELNNKHNTVDNDNVPGQVTQGQVAMDAHQMSMKVNRVNLNSFTFGDRCVM